MKLSEQIFDLKKKIDALKNEYLEPLKKNQDDINKISSELEIVNDNWLGNWFENSNLYSDFINNERKYLQLKQEDILFYTEKKSKVDYNSIKKEVADKLNKIKEFNDELIVEMSIIKSNEQFSEQIDLLKKLEDYEWNLPSYKIIESRKPKTFMGTQRVAEKVLTKGISVPPHISFNAEIISTSSEIYAMKNYITASFRLLREVELLINNKNDEFVGIDNPIINLNRLFDNFHNVSRQLINRYGNRPTIKIDDEYDVQDLLHSILRVFFEDIRPEEYTPSYAGRNTRIDFLLKKEKIIVEVKKTRKSLKDKEVGDELLQDIARYRNHPDCNILYCFVYDPQGLIKNPRGLENDLSSESNEKMTVYVKIRP